MSKSQDQINHEHRVDYLRAMVKARFSQAEIYALCEDVIRSKLEYGGDTFVYTIDDLIEAYLQYHQPKDILDDVVNGIIDEYIDEDELGDNDE